MHQPLANKQAIEARQSVVTELLEEFFLRDELSQLLKNVYDLERLAGRVAFGSVGGRDLAQLRESLRQVPIIQQKLIESSREKCVALGQSLDLCTDIEQLLASAITDHPPISIKEGDVIRDGYNEQLDKYRDASRNGKNWIARVEGASITRYVDSTVKSGKTYYYKVCAYDKTKGTQFTKFSSVKKVKIK